MKTLDDKRNGLLCFALLLAVLLAACNRQGKNDKNTCGLCPMSPQFAPNLSFRVVDKASGKDLFFGNPPAYTIAQLKIQHLVSGKPDSVFLWDDSLNHYFRVFVPTVHNVDTVTMQVANMAKDTLLFETKTTGPCCPSLYLNSVLYDGTVVYTQASGPVIATLAK